MHHTTLRAAAVAAAISTALVLPVASQAAASKQAEHYQLTTIITQQYQAGEVDGTLSMTVYPSGIVQGFYRPLDGNFRTVTGGVDGRNIWLDIGMNRQLHLIGTFDRGVLSTVAQIPGPDTVHFDAVQAKRT